MITIHNPGANMDKNLLELYSDYLISSFSSTTATGLSNLLEGNISHDKITRFLSSEQYGSKDLWQLAKLMNKDYYLFHLLSEMIRFELFQQEI